MSELTTMMIPNVASWIWPTDEDHHEHRAEDRVEPREHVGADDLGVGPARALAGVVRETARDAVLHLGSGEPGVGGLVQAGSALAAGTSSTSPVSSSSSKV